jgi:hypothetical protein
MHDIKLKDCTSLKEYAHKNPGGAANQHQREFTEAKETLKKEKNNNTPQPEHFPYSAAKLIGVNLPTQSNKNTLEKGATCDPLKKVHARAIDVKQNFFIGRTWGYERLRHCCCNFTKAVHWVVQ